MFPVPPLVVGGTSDAPLRSALKDIISAEAGLTANAAVTAKPASVEWTNLVISVFLQLRSTFWRIRSTVGSSEEPPSTDECSRTTRKTS
jgi:hypothetical protein